MKRMNQLDIGGIDPGRIERVVIERMIAIPVVPKLIALPIFAAAAAALYAGIAPLWMFLVPAVVYLVSVWGSWRVQVAHQRNPGAVGGEGGRWLAPATPVAASFPHVLLGGMS